MMEKLKECVSFGEKLGADFVEARFDNLTLRTLERTDDTWKSILVKSRKGFGITAYVEGVSGFSFSASDDKDAIMTATEKAFKMAKTSAAVAMLKLPFEKGDAIRSKSTETPSVKMHPDEYDIAHKTDLVNRCVETAQEHGESVRNIRGLYGELYGKKMLYNSDHSEIDWDFLTTELRVTVTSKTDSGAMVYGTERYGGTVGLEAYAGDVPEGFGKEAAVRAKEQLTAKACPAGKFSTLIEESLVGVLAHESFGHLSEADFVVTGSSPLSGKIGERIGSEHATIHDNGVPDLTKYGGLWMPYDDQGIAGSDTVILNKGILKHYLHNRGTAQKLGQKPSGNARAVQFIYPPICRMTNTYFAPGEISNEEEALEELGTGVYAIQTTGGQVQGDGSFLFKAIRGYWVENGEIQHPLREVALSGNILELLNNVYGATDRLVIKSGYFGGCGKGGQFPLPTGLGGPKLLVKDVTFGGKA
ncbi:MAG: hypothetical protein GF411_19515 [Candidatus Lokiarchaeota archaeon]|nr:hypothetical protein [Candidatus Lokiarchaeota archaeon]